MLAVTVSAEFHVVIPRAVREQLNIEPGQKFQILAFDRRIELLPIVGRAFAPSVERNITGDFAVVC